MVQNATQKFVPIDDVRDGIIILKDGGLRGLLMASSVNFSLKSDDERQAILMQFQDFLNSLDFSVQIVVQSRKLDIRPYIALLENRYKEQTNDLMKIQIEQYIAFVRSFTESTNIMTKSFFVVIPYDGAIISTKKGFLSNLTPNKNKEQESANNEENFEEQKSQLEQRMGVVEQGLVRCGVRVAKLGTDEAVELFYKVFNPGESEKPIKIS
jgi:type IV secretory pathway VirB4 component